MAASIEDLLGRLCDYDFVRCTVAGLDGDARGKVVPSKNAASFMRKGVEIYAGTIGIHGSVIPAESMPEVCKMQHGSVVWLPDPTSFHPLPWSGAPEVRVAEVYGQTHYPDGMKPQGACARQAALNQLKRLNERGWQFLSGTEVEFRILEENTRKPAFTQSYYCHQKSFAANEDLLFHLALNLEEAGVSINAMHTEYSPGQFEFVLKAEHGIKGPDNTFLLKNGVWEMLHKQGLNASFAGKSGTEGAGSGSHFNFSVWDKATEKNVFADSSASDGLSSTAQHWIAGLLKHVDALTAFCAPTSNCYRRFHHPWSPGAAYWAIGDRFSTIRVKTNGEDGTYIENRLPSTISNPYLVLAATIAAGLDGVDKALPCPPPAETDAPAIPHTFRQAIDALDSNTVMREALGDEMVDWFTGIARTGDLDKFKDHNPKEDNDDHLQAEIVEYEPCISERKSPLAKH